MPQPLRVLVVEDNRDDAELILRQLRRADFEPIGPRVDTEADFLAHLDAGLDVVLCDYALPTFSGLRALKLLTERGLDVPFLLISATIGEETAVEAVRLGATDYLLKDRLTRLGPAILQALEQRRLREERRRAEARIHEQASLLDLAQDGIVVADLQGRVQYWNKGSERILGWTADELVGRRADEFLHVDAARVASPEATLRQLGHWAGEVTVATKDGRSTVVSTRCTLLRDPQGQPKSVLVIATEITEQKRAEDGLRLFRTLIDRSSDGIQVLEPATGRFLDVNESACQALGYSREELLQLTIFDVARDVDRAAFDATIAGLHSSGRATRETRHWRKDGSTYFVEVSLSPVALDRDYLVAIVRDITQRRASEAALRERTAFFEAQVESAPDAILVVDEHAQRLLQNHRLLEMFPPPERPADADNSDLLRRIGRQTKHPQRFTQRTSRLAARPDEVGRDELELVDGRVLECYSAPVRDPGGKYYGRIWTFRDVTESRRLEAQLLRTQRLEAIGTLSSGIAHDLNNILAPMLMAAGLLREQLRNPHHRELLAMMETGAQRGANIIRQLLTFSRGIEGERVPLQLRHLIKEMAGIARETFPRNIALVEDASADLRPVLADATQLHQVLMNLCINARDAMPGGGTLTLHAENIDLVADRLPAQAEARPGAYVLLRVSDTGEGISPEIIERIFDPFFTTKGLGKGTGLGLSTVLGIVKSHGGFIVVDNQPAGGASFRVYLPAQKGASESVRRVTTAPIPIGAGEGVLVVDDEDAVRRATCLALERAKFRPFPVSGGEEGLALFAAHRAEIRLAVVDLMMPAMGGVELIRALRAIEPALGIVAVTGMEAEDERLALENLGVRQALMKPYTPRQLVEAVAQALVGQ